MAKKQVSFRTILIVMFVVFLVASLWNSFPLIKNSVHAVLGPSFGVVLNWHLYGGMIIIALFISLITTLIQKYTTDQKALKELKQGLRWNPDNVKCNRLLGDALLASGKIEASQVYYAKALAINPHDPAVRIGTAIAWLQLAQPQQAIPHFRFALRLRPKDADLLNNLGVALGMTGEVDQAIVEFRKAIELSPNHAGAQRNLQRALGAVQP